MRRGHFLGMSRFAPSPLGGAPPVADASALYGRYGEAVFRRAKRMLRDENAARDATQETFLKAHRYRASYKGGSGLSWVFTICDRVCLDALAQRKRHAPVFESEAFEELADEGQEGSLAPWSEERLVRDDLVAQLLKRADKQTQAILIHRYFDDMKAEEIAEKVGASERTIRRRLTDFFAAARAFVREISKPMTAAEGPAPLEDPDASH